MSWTECNEPRCESKTPVEAVETVVVPRSRDLGGFEVRRVLPAQQRQMVGPFVFFDQMGPSAFDIGSGMDVRPHPHIGIATITFLFQGEILHRDSLGTKLAIRPGEVNWMTAGRGIAHSERTDEALRDQQNPLFGIQAWIALPKPAEEEAPDFSHFEASDLPEMSDTGLNLRLIAGSLFGKTSPVQTFSDMYYAHAELREGASISIPAEHEERAIYLVAGAVTLDGRVFEAGQLLVLRPHQSAPVTANVDAQMMLLGGEPMDGPRHLWWNFVSSSKERIEQAKADWRNDMFGQVPGETEFIPLPADRLTSAK
jgi:redox-sensitive bicupin YhaK (pirin superfamily)